MLLSTTKLHKPLNFNTKALKKGNDEKKNTT